MKRLSTEYSKIYHFEDNVQTISQCSQTVNSKLSQYAGHIVNERISSIMYKNNCIFVGPPGSGKTTMFTLLAKRFEKVFWISPDKISHKYHEENGQTITPEEMHAALLTINMQWNQAELCL